MKIPETSRKDHNKKHSPKGGKIAPLLLALAGGAASGGVSSLLGPQEEKPGQRIKGLKK